MSDETLDIPAGDLRPFQLHFSVDAIREIGSMDGLPEEVSLTAIDRDENQVTRDP